MSTTVGLGQATSDEDVMDTPSRLLSPESQSEEQVVEEVWDGGRVSRKSNSITKGGTLHVHVHRRHYSHPRSSGQGGILKLVKWSR